MAVKHYLLFGHKTMITLLEWVYAVYTTDVLSFNNSPDHTMYNPGLLLQRLSHNSISSFGPIESYSDKTPTRSPKDVAHDLYPIDVLYGCYDPTARQIQIFTKAIERDKALYNSTFDDLLNIVRLHEYAHAFVHLGIREGRFNDVLFLQNSNGLTNWTKFLEQRLDVFNRIDNASHEFLAQALTVACIFSCDEPHRGRLETVFHNLEQRQPSHYHVPKESLAPLAALSDVHWDIALDMARGEGPDIPRDGFDLRTGLNAIILLMSETNDAELCSIVVEDELTDALKNSLRRDDNSSLSQFSEMELLIDKYHGLKVEIFAREHPPPHFRVINGSESANYSIKDCSQLNGGLRREYVTVKKWHGNNKNKLIEAWNSRRPTDCPVGPYRDEEY